MHTKNFVKQNVFSLLSEYCYSFSTEIAYRLYGAQHLEPQFMILDLCDLCLCFHFVRKKRIGNRWAAVIPQISSVVGV